MDFIIGWLAYLDSEAFWARANNGVKDHDDVATKSVKKSFTPEALYIVGSCHERDNKKIFMSSPARAEGYDTPAQQREDSTAAASSMVLEKSSLVALDDYNIFLTRHTTGPGCESEQPGAHCNCTHTITHSN